MCDIPQDDRGLLRQARVVFTGRVRLAGRRYPRLRSSSPSAGVEIWNVSKVKNENRQTSPQRPNVGVNDDRLGSLVVMLGDGSDGFGAGDLGGVVGRWIGVGGSSSWWRRSASSRVPVGVMVMPRQPREARSSTAHTRLRQRRFAGQPADHLHPAAGLAEGAFDEVGVPDPAVVLDRETQVAGQLFAIGEQALDRGRVGAGVLLGEGVDAPLHGGDQLRPGRAVPAAMQVVGVEDRPVRVAQLASAPRRAPWQAGCGSGGSGNVAAASGAARSRRR